MIVRLVAALLLMLCCAGTARAGERWIVVSDMHLNPFDKRPFPTGFSHDTNEVLFDSAVAEMRKVEPNPSLVIVGGDFLAHHFPNRSRAAHGRGAADRDALDAIRAQAAAFDRAFPHARFAVTFGNNDDPCGDYRSETSGKYLRDLAAIWLPLMERGKANPGLRESFDAGGYGVVPALGGRARVISVNSVFWSFFYLGSCAPGARSPGDVEMAWLARTLQQTPPHVKNIVLTHIPPGVDATTTTGVRVVGVPFWHERYRRSFEALFADPHNAVSWAVAGHTHRSDMRVVGNVPMLLVGALSPIYRNQPTFVVLDVDDDGTLRDVHPYGYSEDDDTWSPMPSFDAFWGVHGFTIESVRQIHERLANDPSLRDRWAQRYIDDGERIDNITPATWLIYWCAQTTGGDAFASCSGAHRLGNVVLLAVGAVALVVGSAIALALWVRRRATSR